MTLTLLWTLPWLFETHPSRGGRRLFVRAQRQVAMANLMQGTVEQTAAVMRIFERIRKNFGFLPIELQKESRKTRELAGAAAATAYAPAAAEGMCCGHCSGNAEGHIAELPTAR